MQRRVGTPSAWLITFLRKAFNMNKSTSITQQSLDFEFPQKRRCGRKLADITGNRYGRLVAVAYSHQNKKTLYCWLCRCDCGKECIVTYTHLKSGHTRSCGCLAVITNTTHGDSGGSKKREPEYTAFAAMLRRCSDTKSRHYPRYGGRGIRVCDEWNGFEYYPSFLAHVGRRPSDQHSLDRYPNLDGNYEPGNVRWATREEQAQNTSKNVYLTYNGLTLCLCEWARRCGFANATLNNRIKRGWDLERALTTPVQFHSKKPLE